MSSYEYGIMKHTGQRRKRRWTVFLRKSRQKGGRVYLAIVEGYRRDGKVKQRTVESLGYLDELEKRFDDPVAHFKAVCDERNAAAKAERQAVPIEIHPMERIDRRARGRKNIGSAALLSIYSSLGLERTVRNNARGSKATFDLNAVLRLLVCERILNPGSKAAAWGNRDGYFFRSEFEEQHVYRALSMLEPMRDKIVSAINRSIDKQGVRDMTSVFYDVTNYYFECDPDDFRRKGVCKEHKPNPIVQMGLLQDKNAVPIGYKLFSGNTNDCSTMMDVLADMKRDYKLDRVIVVADKGLNTSNNIAACVGRGDGFVYSQSIRGAKSTKELRNWVLADEGYREQGDGFKIKSRQDTKMITVVGADGKERKVPVETKTVAFWSRKYAERARHERAAAVERARELARDPGAYSAATHFGAAKYVDGLKVDKDTGEVLEGATALTFNEAKLAADEACDGYYCLVTSEYELPDEDIVDIYRGLWRIEESFKVTKSDLEARPVYCSTREHIEAHFLTCYVALCILRLLQLRTGNKYSAAVIADELGKMCGTNVDGNWWCFDHRSDASDEICASAGIDLSRKFMQLKDIKKVLAQANGR